MPKLSENRHPPFPHNIFKSATGFSGSAAGARKHTTGVEEGAAFKAEQMPAFVRAGCPRKLHKHTPKQQPFCLAVTLPSWCSVRLGRETRRARVSTDDLREKQLRGSLPAEEVLSREPRCRLPSRGVCSAHSRGFGTKPAAFPGLEIIKRMKSCCPGAAGGKMDGASREGGGGTRSALPHGKGRAKTFPFYRSYTQTPQLGLLTEKYLKG